MKRQTLLLGALALLLLALFWGWRTRSSLAPAVPRPGSTSTATLRPLQRVLLSSETPPAARSPKIVPADGDARPVDPFGAPYDDDAPLEGVMRPAPRELPPGARETIAAVLEDEIREKGGAFGYNSRRYGATLDSGSVEFATAHRFRKIGSPRLGYSLDQITVGETVVARGGPAAATVDAETRTVVYPRGTVDETYTLRPEALEQTFVVKELPDGRGAITVAGRVTTNLEPPADGTRGAGLSFSHRGVGVIALSDALAIDADGRRQPLELAYDQGRLSMTVPAEWVATAALPIRIDPLVGPAFNVVNSTWGNGNTNYTVDYFTVRTCDAAYSALNQTWFVVWTEKWGASTYDYDIRAQRVNANGTLAGGIVGIVTTSAGSYEPTIAVGRTTNAGGNPWDRYLITWRHDPTADGGISDQNIWGKVHDQDGVFFTLSPFAISNTAGQDLAPSAAYDGTRFFVTWTNRTSLTRYDVRGQFVTATGTVPNINTTYNPAIVTNIAGGSSTAFANGVYCIAWEEGTSGSRSVRARTMNPNGTFPSPAVDVEPAANTPVEVDVSNGGTRFLVGWRRASNHDINARIVNASASNPLTFAGATFNVATGNTVRQTPRIGYSSTDNAWLVVYRDAVTGGGDVYGAKVSSAGVASAPVAISTAAVDEWRPELAWNSVTNEFLVVYRKDPVTSLLLLGQRYSLSAPPPAPTNLVGTAGDGQASLSWAAASGASSYNLKRGTTSGGPYSNVQVGIVGTSAVDSPLTNGTAYYYVVSAVNASGESGISNQAAVTPQPPAPAAPTNLVAVAGDGQVTLTWTASVGATSYAVKRATSPGGPYTVINPSVAGTSFVDTTVTNGIAYSYIVTASNGGGESGASGEAPPATPAPPPAAPTNVTATPGSGTITISWTGSDGATSYTLKRSTAPGGPFPVLEPDILSTSFTDNNVDVGTTYYYVVAAVNAAGAGPNSAVVSGTPLDPALKAPEQFTAVSSLMIGSTTIGKVQLAWNNALGSTWGFNVKRANTPGGPYTTLAVRTPLQTYTDRNLALGRTYYYAVSAVYAGGESEDVEKSVLVAYPFRQPPSQQITVMQATGQNGAVQLEWRPVTTASDYLIYRIAPGDEVRTVVSDQEDLFFTDTGLVNGVTYTYTLIPRNHHGEGSSTEFEATPQSVAPQFAPSLTSLSNVNGVVLLAWSRGDHVTGYSVEASSSGEEGTWVAASGHYLAGQATTNVGNTMWLDSINQSPTFFRVKAVNLSGEKASDSISLSVVEPAAKPAAPTLLRASHANGRLRISWKQQPESYLYQILRSEMGGPVQVWDTTYATVYEDLQVTNNNSYSYWVRGVNNWGASPDSALAFTTPLSSTNIGVGAPLNSTAVFNGSGIDVAWDDVPNATGYIIRKSEQQGGPYNFAQGVPASQTVGGPAILFTDWGKTFYFRVWAVDAGGEGPPSIEMTVELPPLQ